MASLRYSPKPPAAASCILFLILTLLTCSPDNGGTGPIEEEAVAVITGPDQVVLNCLDGAVGEFGSHESSGPIDGFRWEVDGVKIRQGGILEYTFREARDHAVTLKGLDGTGAVITTAEKVVSAQLPDDLVGCLDQSRIIGKEGALLRTGQSSLRVEYTVSTAALAEGKVDSYAWTVAKEGGDPEPVASGPNLHTVQVTFTEGGLYEIGLVQVVGTATLAHTLPVKIYTGEPVSEPGKILVFNSETSSGWEGRSESGRNGIYFMDGETGHVSGPVLESGFGGWDPEPNRFSSSGACDSDRVVFRYITEPDVMPDFGLWQINHDGIGLRELVAHEGSVQHPDINVRGDIAFIDDTRWNRQKDELAIYTHEGNLIYASGSTVNTRFNGFHPSWSPDGTRIALGANYITPGSQTDRRVAIFHVDVDGGNIYREADGPPKFPFLLENEIAPFEGSNGVAWDPRNEYIAYTVIGSDPSYSSRFLLVLWRIGTSEVRVLAENVRGNLEWSPNGDYLLFRRGGNDWAIPGIWQIPREGGDPINLSDLSLKGANDSLGGFCK